VTLVGFLLHADFATTALADLIVILVFPLFGSFAGLAVGNPTLVVVGEPVAATAPSIACMLAKALPKADCIEISGCGQRQWHSARSLHQNDLGIPLS
jgi:hypothetical protein